MRKNQPFRERRFLLLLCGFFPYFGMAQTMPDAMPAPARIAKATPALGVMDMSPAPSLQMEKPCLELNVENLLAVLEEYGVKHKEIVAAQAILETGYFTSQNCTGNHNLFGLRHPSDGSYYTFDNWEESVKAYRDDVQYKYAGGDYYAFLRRIGYAADRHYTSKVRRIKRQLFPTLLAASTTD